MKKLVSSGFHPAESAFFSLLGISYYLSEPDFRSLLRSVGHIAAVGSALCLDYPTDEESRIASVNRALAQGAGEAMNARYSPLRDGGAFMRHRVSRAGASPPRRK